MTSRVIEAFGKEYVLVRRSATKTTGRIEAKAGMIAPILAIRQSFSGGLVAHAHVAVRIDDADRVAQGQQLFSDERSYPTQCLLRRSPSACADG
jgi:hypothetical protein